MKSCNKRLTGIKYKNMTDAAIRAPNPTIKLSEPNASTIKAALRRMVMCVKCFDVIYSTLPSHPNDLLIALVTKIVLISKRAINGSTPSLKTLMNLSMPC